MTIKKYRPYLTSAQISRILRYAADNNDTDLIRNLSIFAFKATTDLTKPVSITETIEEKLGFQELTEDQESALFKQIMNKI